MSATANFPPDLDKIERRIAAGSIRHERINVRHPEKNTLKEVRFDFEAEARGSITVTVIEILANGNLVVRGEKKLGLSEGTEVIQVAGVIRPQDVGPNGTVNSLRLANAQISYRGSGDLASASKPGWGTTGLMKFWPF